MNNSFLGVSKHSLENGNRLIIPSHFRDALTPEFVIFKSMDGCVSIYEKCNFEELLSQVNQFTNTKEGRIKARTLTRAAKFVSLDKQGRVTIPAEFIEHAKLGENIYLTGEGNRLEIWNEEEFLRQEEEVSFDDYPEIFY